MKTSLCAAMLLLFLAPALAQPTPNVADLRKATDQAMEKIGKGDVEGGLKSLKSRLIIPSAEFETLLGQTNLQLPAMKQRFGGNLGHEFLREDKLGENLIRWTYIQRYDKHAVRWVFYNYRGKDGWVVNSFRFDDNLPSLFP